MAASAGQVFTGLQGGRGDGTGTAAILDKANDFSQDPYYRLWERDRAAAALAQQEAAKKQNKAWAALELEAPNVWDVDSPFLEQDLMSYDNMITEMKMAGQDPEDLYGEAGKKVKGSAAGLEKRKKIADDNQAYYDQAKLAIDKSDAKYDKAYAAQWLKDYVDPKKTPEDRMKMRMDSTPFKLNYSFDEFVTNTTPAFSTNTAGTVDFVDKETQKQRALIQMQDNPELFEAFKADGHGDTPEAVAEKVAELGQKYTPMKRDRVSTSSGSGSGGSDAKPKVQLGFDFRNVEGLNTGVSKNVARVIKSGTQDDLPFVQVSTLGGKKKDGTAITEDNIINFEPVEFVYGKDGRIGVRGVESTMKGAGAYATTETEEVWIDYDRNKALFDAQLGVDLYKEFGASQPAQESETAKKKVYNPVTKRFE